MAASILGLLVFNQNLKHSFEKHHKLWFRTNKGSQVRLTQIFKQYFRYKLSMSAT